MPQVAPPRLRRASWHGIEMRHPGQPSVTGRCAAGWGETERLSFKWHKAGFRIQRYRDKSQK